MEEQKAKNIAVKYATGFLNEELCILWYNIVYEVNCTL